MPKISVCIDVSDRKKGIEFYTRILDAKVVNESQAYTELLADSLTIYIAEKAAGTNPIKGDKAVRSYERHWTPVHLDVVVTNLEQSVAAVIEMGGVKEEQKSGDWGAIAFCSDPFGNGFCMMQYN